MKFTWTGFHFSKYSKIVNTQITWSIIHFCRNLPKSGIKLPRIFCITKGLSLKLSIKNTTELFRNTVSTAKHTKGNNVCKKKKNLEHPEKSQMLRTAPISKYSYFVSSASSKLHPQTIYRILFQPELFCYVTARTAKQCCVPSSTAIF